MSGEESGRLVAMRPDDDPGWASYGDTLLRFPGPEPLEIDLRVPVSGRVRDALAVRGLGQSFGLLTPENPRGRRTSPEDNADRWVRFLTELDSTGTWYVRADGCSRDGRHVEHGVALLWSQGEIVALARQWEQSAIYWWDGARFWVVGALTVAAPWLVGAPG